MLTRTEIGTIENTIRDFFQKMGEEIEIKDKIQEQEQENESSFGRLGNESPFRRLGNESPFGRLGNEVLTVNLDSQAPQFLIGEGGQTLEEIQHLLRIILTRKLGKPFYFNLDINNYKKKKTVYLQELARTFADEASLFKKEKELPAMPSQERRIIHLALSQRQDVITQSQGEEPNRRVVIRPRPAAKAASEGL